MERRTAQARHSLYVICVAIREMWGTRKRSASSQNLGVLIHHLQTRSVPHFDKTIYRERALLAFGRRISVPCNNSRVTRSHLSAVTLVGEDGTRGSRLPPTHKITRTPSTTAHSTSFHHV